MLTQSVLPCCREHFLSLMVVCGPRPRTTVCRWGSWMGLWRLSSLTSQQTDMLTSQVSRPFSTYRSNPVSGGATRLFWWLRRSRGSDVTRKNLEASHREPKSASRTCEDPRDGLLLRFEKEEPPTLVPLILLSRLNGSVVFWCQDNKLASVLALAGLPVLKYVGPDGGRNSLLFSAWAQLQVVADSPVCS